MVEPEYCPDAIFASFIDPLLRFYAFSAASLALTVANDANRVNRRKAPGFLYSVPLTDEKPPVGFEPTIC